MFKRIISFLGVIFVCCMLGTNVAVAAYDCGDGYCYDCYGVATSGMSNHCISTGSWYQNANSPRGNAYAAPPTSKNRKYCCTYCSTSQYMLSEAWIYGTCNNAGYNCNNGNDAKFSEGEYWDCYRCGTAHYSVFDTDGTFLSCATCAGTPGMDQSSCGPLQTGTGHVADTQIKFRCIGDSYNYSNGVAINDGPFTRTLHKAGTNNSSSYYSCDCTKSNTYKGRDGNNNVISGTCFSCPSSDVATCNNTNGFTACLQNYTYMVRHENQNDYQYQTSMYGKYECRQCPGIANYNDMGVGSSNVNYALVTWSSTSRCTATSQTVQTEASSGCTYRLSNIKPNCAENTHSNITDIEYSTETLPNASNMTLYAGECNYSYTKQYVSAPAGKGATSNNTQNATCGECPDGKYSTADMVTCQNPPANATVNADKTDFLCNKGYFKINNECARCPYEMGSMQGPNDVSSWVQGTTGGPGATSMTECYIEGGSTGEQYDGVGYYTIGGFCPVVTAFNGYRLCFDTTYSSSVNMTEFCNKAWCSGQCYSDGDYQNCYNWMGNIMFMSDNCSDNVMNSPYTCRLPVTANPNIIYNIFKYLGYAIRWGTCDNVIGWD